MNPNLSIRTGGPDDLNTIGFLAQQIWPATYSSILTDDQLRYMMNLFYSPSALKKQMQEQKHEFLMVEDEGTPIGFASYAATGEPSVYKLHKLYVLPGRQGSGLGKTIIDFIIEHIKPLGATSLQLNVNRHNKALGFYKKIGFIILREEDIDIGEGYFMNDFVMNFVWSRES